MCYLQKLSTLISLTGSKSIISICSTQETTATLPVSNIKTNSTFAFTKVNTTPSMVDASAAAGAAKWIGSALIEEAKYLYGAEESVQSLQRDLVYMQQLLQDVDTNPHLTRQDGQLRNFAQDIQELAFRAEDAIDSYILDVAIKINRKSFFLKFACLTAHFYPVHVLIKEIEAIKQDIQKARQRFDMFGSVLKTSENTGSSSSSRTRPAENYIHLDDEVVVGIDADISSLAKRLIDLEDDYKVLAIVGTGGAGKSTLAVQLYNHAQVKSVFPHKAFVSISQQWSRIDVLQRIFKEVMGGDVIPSGERELAREVHDFLKDKQCLIVLDDMWKTEAWDDIYPMLPRSNKGCRVIITTQIEEVPMHADTKCITHKPKLLTMDQKWELFSKIAMEGRVGIEKNAEFEKLGRQMLKKCEGLPLAVVTLAGVLRTKQEWYQWEEVSKEHAKYILKGKGKHNYGVVEDMLELSYFDMPTYLKPCLLYFAIFLEDWRFKVFTVIGMWIAEGFVTNDLQTRHESTLEDVAMRLLDELARRCVLQVTNRNIQGQIQQFRVHDLVREFCIKKAEEYHFVGAVSSTFGSRKPRRIGVFSRELYPNENHHLRTLFNFGIGGEELPIEARGNLESVPNKFKLLRVLCIWSLDYAALPDEIGKLIHLRYLNIVDSKILVLPKSIRSLRNLLYLIYISTNVVEVAHGLVGNMENLRALILPESQKRGSLNRLGLNGPKKLQWPETGAGKWMTKELPTLSTTVRDLRIYNIQKKEELEALYQCSCTREDSLRRLALGFDRSMSSEKALEFDLEKLRGCTTLWELGLDFPLASNCNGTNIQFPPNLVSLSLYRCVIKEWDDLMNVLGELPKLKELNLTHDSYLGTKLSCTNSGFQQLQALTLGSLVNLEEWRMEEGAMARLRNLWIDKCPKLKRLPESIRSITTLKELKITRMPEEFCRRIRYKGSTSEAEDSYIFY